MHRLVTVGVLRWNAGASHMNAAFPKVYFDRLGLVSLLDYQRRFQCLS